MRIVLDIEPYIDRKLDCLQNTLISMLKKHTAFPYLILLGTWNFHFDHDQPDNHCIGSMLSSGKGDTFANCEKFYQLKRKSLPAHVNIEDAINDCLLHGDFVLIEVAVDKIPWKLNQDIYMAEHYCLIKGLHAVHQVYDVMDTHAENQEDCILPFHQLSMINRMWRIDVSAVQGGMLSSVEAIDLIYSNMSDSLALQKEYKFLQYLTDHTLDMDREVKAYENNIGFCPMLWEIYNIGTGRYQTAVLIGKLEQYYGEKIFTQYVHRLLELSKLWEDLRNVLIKYYRKPRESLYQRILAHVHEIIQKEETLFTIMKTYGSGG